MSRTDQLTYTYEEIMADHAYAARLRRGPVLFHGGLDSQGRYVPPRSRHRGLPPDGSMGRSAFVTSDIPPHRHDCISRRQSPGS